jgi:uncharacterized cysteine cluster protein YcgN (CxxCxxCC family)
MSHHGAPKHLYVEYMYGFLFHYTHQPLLPTTPAYTLVKELSSDGKHWEAIYKTIDGDKATFHFDGVSIKMKKTN